MVRTHRVKGGSVTWQSRARAHGALGRAACANKARAMRNRKGARGTKQPSVASTHAHTRTRAHAPIHKLFEGGKAQGGDGRRCVQARL